MLPKINRLNKDKDFARVFKEGRSSYNNLLGIKCAKNGLDITRFGILVGVKTSKKAVARNLIKRRIREALRNALVRLKQGYDLVIIALPPSVEADYAGISHSINSGLAKLRILK